MGGRGTTMNSGFGSGQKYENRDFNIYIKGVDSSKKTVRFIEGYSPSAIHEIQEIPQKDLKKYMKKHGYKMTRYYD